MVQQLKQYKGVTLLELMLALAVIASLMFVAVRYYTVARENAKIVQATHNINIAVDASYKWIEGKNFPNFCGPPGSSSKCLEGISADKLVEAGLLTAEDIKNPWVGGYSLGVNAYPGVEKYVAIGYVGISKSACLSLEQKFTNKVKIYNGKPLLNCFEYPKQGFWEFSGGF